jgi:hypothetical protein
VKAKWIILFLAAVTLAVDGLYGTSVKQQYDSKGWPRISGVITKSWLDRHTHGSTFASLAYVYKVDGQMCWSRRYKFVDNDPAETVIGRFPVGAQVAVFYNPQDPKISVLSPGLTSSDLDGMIIFACLNAIPMLVIWFVWSKYEEVHFWGGSIKRKKTF